MCIMFVLALMQRLELEILRASNDRPHRTLNRLTYGAQQSSDVGCLSFTTTVPERTSPWKS